MAFYYFQYVLLFSFTIMLCVRKKLIINIV